MPAKISLIGKRFGKLKVISDAEPFPEGRTHRHAVICLCSCGKTKRIRVNDIKSNKTKTCGCGVIESTIRRSFKHGHSSRSFHTPTYRSWKGMFQRCNNSNNPEFKNYGARRVAICQEWNDYTTFLRDMGPRPLGTSIGRINNDAGYMPGNCRWETGSQQSRNKRTVPVYTVNGITGCVATLAEHFGHPPRRIHNRLYDGWSIEKALLTPFISPQLRWAGA